MKNKCVVLNIRLNNGSVARLGTFNGLSKSTMKFYLNMYYKTNPVWLTY